MLINHKNLALVQKSAEFECAGIKHENVISYENVTLDKVHDTFAYIAGKSNVNITKLISRLTLVG